MIPSKEIDGKVYEFQKLGAKVSLKLLLRISKIIGGPLSVVLSRALGAAGKASIKGLMEADLSQFKIEDAVQMLMDNVNVDEALDIIEQLTSGDNVLCDGKKIVFNRHYEGELLHLFKVAQAGFEVQYGNFFDAFLAKKSAQKVPAQVIGSDQQT